MTPFQIEIILHHHCSAADFPRYGAPLYGPTVSDLIHDEILTDHPDGRIRTTHLGKALVEMWCSTPLPVQRFVDPRFEKGPAA